MKKSILNKPCMDGIRQLHSDVVCFQKKKGLLTVTRVDPLKGIGWNINQCYPTNLIPPSLPPKKTRRVPEGERLGWRKSGCQWWKGKDWRLMEKIAEMPYFYGLLESTVWCIIVFGGSEIWKFAVVWSGLTSKVLTLAYFAANSFLERMTQKKQHPKRLKRFHSWKRFLSGVFYLSNLIWDQVDERRRAMWFQG